jgi:hypothetical protein
MSNATIKMSLHLSPDANSLLEEISEKGHMSKSDVLRKSVILMKFFIDSKEKGHHLILVNDKNEKITEITNL